MKIEKIYNKIRTLDNLFEEDLISMNEHKEVWDKLIEPELREIFQDEEIEEIKEILLMPFEDDRIIEILKERL